MNLELLRFIIGTVVLAAGLLTFAMEVFGSYRFEFVLNRMHAAALGDTLGIGISLTGLIIISGLNFTSLKMLLVIMFLWFASPCFLPFDFPSGGYDGRNPEGAL